MEWITIIPIRAGSKGVKNKNIYPICGKPLYQYTVDFAMEAGAKKIYISTNITEILAKPHNKKIVIEKREEGLCSDHTKMSCVILNFLNGKEGRKIKNSEVIVLLQATSPVRQKIDLLTALKQFESTDKIDLMMAVTEAENHVLKYGFVLNGHFKHVSEPHLCFENRQNLPKLFKPTGSFYIFKAGWFRANKSLATKSTGAYEIPKNQSLDIDSLIDLKRFESLVDKEGTKR